MERPRILSMDQKFLQDLSDLVIANLKNDQFGAEELSREIGLSRSQVHRKLQKINGKSITQFIREIRLEEALKLLQKEVGTASEIAFMTGFSSHAYFTKCFHDYFGYPPIEVKEKSRSHSSAKYDETNIIPIHKAEEKKQTIFDQYKEEEQEVNGPNHPAKRNTILYVALALTGLLIVTVVLLLFQLLPIKEKSLAADETILDKSIVVFPFRNNSPDQGNQHLGNGIMEEILNNLQRIQDLRVIPYYGEMYENSETNLASIAAKLEAAYFLSGSFRKVGDSIRVYVRVINSATGDQVWGDRYDDAFSNKYLDFQTAIPKKIAASLNAVITPEEEKEMARKSTSEIMAYNLYWRGLDLNDLYGRTNDLKYLEMANELFDKALSIDPNYVEAIFGKGHGIKTRAQKTNGNYDSALMYANRAIKISPEHELGYFLKGECYLDIGKPELAIENFLKSVKLKPNWNWSNVMTGFVYCQQLDDYIKGIPYIEKAVKLEGRAPYLVLDFTGRMFLHLGDYEKASEYYIQSIDLDPSCRQNIFGYFRLLTSQGKFKEAENFADSICEKMDCAADCVRFQFCIKYNTEEYNQAEIYLNEFIEAGGSPYLYDSVRIAFVYRKLGKEKEAMTIVEKIISTYENELISSSKYLINHSKHILYNLSSVHAMLNDKKKALEYLAQAVEIGLIWGCHDFIEIDPVFENLRDDPEFKSIVKRAQEEKAAMRAEIRAMRENGELDL